MTKSIKQQDGPLFENSDLGSAATLELLYQPVEAVDRQNPGRVLMLFKREQGLDQLLEAYWKSQLRVEPKALFNRLKEMKARLKNDW